MPLPRWQDIIAVWFLILAAISASIITYGLSAYQVRLRIQTFAVSNTPVTVQQLRRIQKKQLTPSFVNMLEELSGQRNDFRRIQQDLDGKYFQAQRTASDEILTILYAIQQADREFKYDTTADPLPSDVRRARIQLLLQAQSARLTEQLKDNFKNMEDALAAMENASSEGGKAKERVEELEKRIAAADQERKSYEPLEVVRAVLAEPNLQAAQLVKIDDLLGELKSLDDSFSYMRFLLDVPQEFLTLLLVIAAGALGQSIQLIHAYLYATERGQLQNKAIDPFFGAIVALVLFVVVKAGVLIAVDPRGSGQAGAELSPFFVVFLGIVGGLLSNQVVEKIRSYGQDWLRATVPQKARWARSDIERLIAEKNKDKKLLAQILDVEEPVVETWLKGEAPVPYEVQRMISAWLETQIRDLFSEIPPFNQPPLRQ